MSKKSQSKARPAAGRKSGAPLARPTNAQRRASAAAASTAPIVAPGFRSTLERYSRPALVRLSALPQWMVPMMLGGVLVAGLALPFRWAGLLLIVLGLFLSWLIALSWPRISVLARLVRIIVTLSIFGFSVLRLTGRM